eukprot:TRINITY_DN1274_c0_g1_i2.p1 TRINITY_DN1274_c0_g1~~TRINITY_DN1274_c0_g1_i2.p1  ORF type:complete len:1384 (+),score=520.61 TRINITY_DN1274_c0_g1_i2:71-4222(+)
MSQREDYDDLKVLSSDNLLFDNRMENKRSSDGEIYNTDSKLLNLQDDKKYSKKDPKKIKKLYKKLMKRRPKNDSKLDREGSEESVLKRKKKRGSKLQKTSSTSKLPGEIKNEDEANDDLKNGDSKNGESKNGSGNINNNNINNDDKDPPKNGAHKQDNMNTERDLSTRNLSRKSKTLGSPLNLSLIDHNNDNKDNKQDMKDNKQDWKKIGVTTQSLQNMPNLNNTSPPELLLSPRLRSSSPNNQPRVEDKETPNELLQKLRSNLRVVDKKVDDNDTIDKSSPVRAVSDIRRSIRNMNNDFQESVVTPSQFRNLLNKDNNNSNNKETQPIQRSFVTRSKERGTGILPINFIVEKNNTFNHDTTNKKNEKINESNNNPIEKNIPKKIILEETKKVESPNTQRKIILEETKKVDSPNTQRKIILEEVTKKVEKAPNKIILEETKKIESPSTQRKIILEEEKKIDSPPKKIILEEIRIEKKPSTNKILIEETKKVESPTTRKFIEEIKNVDSPTTKKIILEEETKRESSPSKKIILEEVRIEKKPSTNKILIEETKKVESPTTRKLIEETKKTEISSPTQKKIVLEEVRKNNSTSTEKIIEKQEISLENHNSNKKEIPEKIKIIESVREEEEILEVKSAPLNSNKKYTIPDHEDLIMQDILSMVFDFKAKKDKEIVNNKTEQPKTGGKDGGLKVLQDMIISTMDKDLKENKDNKSKEKPKEEIVKESQENQSPNFDNLDEIFNGIYTIDEPTTPPKTNKEEHSPVIVNKEIDMPIIEMNNTINDSDLGKDDKTINIKEINNIPKDLNKEELESIIKIKNSGKENGIVPKDEGILTQEPEKKKKTIIKKIIRKVVQRKKCKACGALNPINSKVCKCGESIGKKSTSEINNKSPKTTPVEKKPPVDEVQETLATFSLYSIHFKNAKFLDVINMVSKESMRNCLSNYDNESLYTYMTDSAVIKKMLFFIFSRDEIVYVPSSKKDYEYMNLISVKDYICDVICNKDFDDILDTIVNDRNLSAYLFSYLKKDPMIVDEKDGATLYYYKCILSAVVQSKFIEFQIELKKPNSHIMSNILRLISLPPIIELLSEIISHDHGFLASFPQLATKIIDQIQDQLKNKDTCSAYVLINFLIGLIQNNKIDPNDFIEIMGRDSIKYLVSQLYEEQYSIFIELFELIFLKLQPTYDEIENGKIHPKTPHPLLLKIFTSDEFFGGFKEVLFSCLKNRKLNVKCYRFLELFSSLLLSQNSAIIEAIHDHELFFVFLDFFFEFIWNSMIHNLVYSVLMRMICGGNKVYNVTLTLLFVKYKFHQKIMDSFSKYYAKESIEEVKNLVYPVPKAGFMDHLLKISIKVGDALLKKLYFPDEVLEEIRNSDWIQFSQSTLLPFILLKK